MKVLNIYFSATGNTAKTAATIEKTVADAGHEVTTVQVKEGVQVEFLDYDMIFMGSGVYHWLPGKPLMKLIEKVSEGYRKSGEIQRNPKRRANIKAVTYCTYGGTHTGIREARPATMWMGQFFEHLGIEVVADWYVIGEFHGTWKDLSVSGRLGDIRNRPNEWDLKDLAEKTRAILSIL
jgi:multimeric flavodoxin WrbA